jgi:hypothetical protein
MAKDTSAQFGEARTDDLITKLRAGNPTIADLQAAVDHLKAHRFTSDGLRSPSIPERVKKIVRH